MLHVTTINHLSLHSMPASNCVNCAVGPMDLTLENHKLLSVALPVEILSKIFALVVQKNGPVPYLCRHVILVIELVVCF